MSDGRVFRFTFRLISLIVLMSMMFSNLGFLGDVLVIHANEGEQNTATVTPTEKPSPTEENQGASALDQSQSVDATPIFTQQPTVETSATDLPTLTLTASEIPLEESTATVTETKTSGSSFTSTPNEAPTPRATIQEVGMPTKTPTSTATSTVTEADREFLITDTGIMNVSAQEAPVPDIQYIKVDGVERTSFTISVGDTFELKVRVCNEGDISYHAGVSVSFPDLRSSSDASRVDHNYDSYGEFDDNHEWYPKGSTIWIDGEKAEADYLLYEALDPSWSSGECNNLYLDITPRDKGYDYIFDVLVKTGMPDSSGLYHLDPSPPCSSSNRDQQNECNNHIYISVEATNDDNYEENDTLSTAYNFSSLEKNWLSSVNGYGIQADDDWYKISISSGYERVQIDCQFNDSEGDIDISLHNSSGTELAESNSSTNDELIDFVVPSSGTYFIRVYYGDKGNQYDLWWDDLAPPNTSPTLSLTGPGSDITVTQGDNVFIQWTDADPDNNASISLARDNDNNPGNGGQSWLTVSLTEDPDGAEDQYSWDTGGVSEGTYYIWGMIYDSVNPEVYSVAPGRVTIQVPVFPVINSLSPTSGPGSTQVEINGSNFGDSRGSNGRVEFGSVNITGDVISWSDTKVVVNAPTNLSHNGHTVKVRNNDLNTSNGKTFTVTQDPNAIISSALSCPSSATVGESFIVKATLRNGSAGVAENGGLSFSFKDFDSTDSSLIAGSTGPYESSQAEVETINSNGTTVAYYDKDDQLQDIAGSPRPAQYLLVESNYSSWSLGTQKELQLRVTPKQALAGQTIRIYMRGTLAWGGDYGWEEKERDPSSTGSGRENDQQQYPAYYCDVVIGDIVETEIPVLMYHKIQPSIIASDYWLTDAMFEAQLKALDEYGYTTLTLDDYIAIRSGSQQPPQNPVIITIDDGYRNLYDHVYPLLQQYNMVATAFLPTGKISSSCAEIDRIDSSWDPNTTEASNPADHLCWDEVRAMDQSVMRFESHSVDHPLLTQQTSTTQHNEIENSKAAIETELTGYSVNHFSYPYGDGYGDAGIHQILEAASYQTAVAASGGIANTATSPIWAIPRMNVSMNNSVELGASAENNFFMRLVDPNFLLPDITEPVIQTFDSQGQERNTFYPGETVTVVVTATNSGYPVNVVASLEIDADQDVNTPSIYDSHQQNPAEDVIKQPFSNDPDQPFTFTWTIPEDASLGEYNIAFSVHDEHYVLGYKYSMWQYSFNVEETPDLPIPEVNLQAVYSPNEEFQWIQLGTENGVLVLNLAYEPGQSNWFVDDRPLFQALVDAYVKAIWVEDGTGNWINDIALERDLAITAQNKAEWIHLDWDDWKYVGFEEGEKECINRLGDDGQNYFICTPYFLTEDAKEEKIYAAWFLWDVLTNGTDDPAVRQDIYKKVLLQLVMQDMNEEYKQKLHADLNAIIERTLETVEPHSEIAQFGWEILENPNTAYGIEASNLAVWYTKMGAANHQLAILDNTETIINGHRNVENFGNYFRGFGLALQALGLGFEIKGEVARAMMLNQLANLESLQRIVLLDEFISHTNDPNLQAAWETAKEEYRVYSNGIWDSFLKNLETDPSLAVDTAGFLASATGYIAHVCGAAGLSSAMAWALPIHMAWSGWNAINSAQDKMRASALAMTLEDLIYQELTWRDISIYGGADEIDRIEYTVHLHAMRAYLAAISFSEMYHSIKDSFLLTISDWIWGVLGVEDNDDLFKLMQSRESDSLQRYNSNGAPNYLASDDVEYLNRNVHEPFGHRANIDSLELRLGAQQQLRFNTTNSGGSADPYYFDVSVSNELEIALTEDWDRDEIGSLLWQNGDVEEPTLVSEHLHYGITGEMPAGGSSSHLLTLIGENPGEGFMKYRAAMVPTGLESLPDLIRRFPGTGDPDQQDWPALTLPIIVLEDPIPEISSSETNITMLVGEKIALTLTLNNLGGPADATYLDISMPDGLDVFSASPATDWDRYNIGDNIWYADGSVGPSSELLYSMPMATFPGYEFSYYEVTIIAEQSGNYDIKYRASLNPKGITKEGTSGDTFIRNPIATDVGVVIDQQGWYAWSIPVTVGTNHEPVINSVQPSGTSDIIAIPNCRIYSIEAFDPNGRQLHYSWYLDNILVSELESYEYCPPNDAEGQHYLDVVISDGVLSVENEWEITVEQDELPMPTNLSATVVSQIQIDLSWEDKSSNETAFLIERSPSGENNWVEIDSVAADVTNYQDDGVLCETPYDYRVRAYRSTDSEYSGYSNTDSTTTFACSGTPEINVQGNNQSIPNGDTIPDVADDTDFGDLDVSTGMDTHTFTILNSGDAELILDGEPKVDVLGAHAAEFTVITQPSSPISGSNSVQFVVEFNSGGVGTRTATISIENNDPNNDPYIFAIQGTGTTSGTPEIEVRFNDNGVSIPNGDTIPSTADGTDFGDVDVTSGSSAHWFRIWNTGTAALVLGSNPRVEILGPHASDFIVTSQPNSPVSGDGNSVQLQVKFDPSGAGLRMATISIANNDSNNDPYTLAIQGMGTTNGTTRTTGLYSYFPLDDKNDAFGFATTGETGPISYASGLVEDSLVVQTDVNNSMIFMGDSIRDPDNTYRDVMYEDATVNVWINIAEFNSLTDGVMGIVGGTPAVSPNYGGCPDGINHWALAVRGVPGCRYGDCPGQSGSEFISLIASSYDVDGVHDRSTTVYLDVHQGPLATDTWYMITIRHDVDTHTWQLFVNGELRGSVTMPDGIGPGALTRACPYAIGDRPMDNVWGYPFSGQIDELAFWSRELSSAEIQQLYNNGKGTSLIGPPVNDDFDSAVEITNFPFATALEVTDATTAPDDPVLPCAGNQKVQSVWYQFTPSIDGTVTIDTSGSNYETVAASWTGTRGSLASHGCIYLDPLHINVTGGTTYYLEIASWDAPGNSRILNFSVSFTPTLIPTDTPTFTQTPSQTPTFTPTSTNTSTLTPKPTSTVTHTNTPTLIPTNTPTSTQTPSQTQTFTPTSTYTSTSTLMPIPCYTLTSYVIPEAGGSVTADPAPNCANGTKYVSGTQVALAASTASNYYRFNSWSGDVTGANNPTQVTVDDNKTITAHFEQSTFADVPFDHVHWAYIEALYDAGFTAGCQDDPELKYCPNQILNRAMSAVFMLRGLLGTGYGPPPKTWDSFNDDWSLSDIAWAKKWAEGMWKEGLTAGCQYPSNAPLLYCPRRELPRIEACVFGLRMKYGINYAPPPATGTLLADLSNSGYWGTKWGEQCYRDELFPGCGEQDGKPMLCSDELVSRDLAAYLIVKAKDLPLPVTDLQPYLTNLEDGERVTGLLTGTPTPSATPTETPTPTTHTSMATSFPTGATAPMSTNTVTPTLSATPTPTATHISTPTLIPTDIPTPTP